MAIKNISFAGAGRVAGALCREMYLHGYKILQIVSETSNAGSHLAGECKAVWTKDPDFFENNDIIIVAVPDRKLESVLHSIKCAAHTLVVHTAGSFGLDVFPSAIPRKGILYPLQTFSKERSVSFRDLPFLIEAGDDEGVITLKDLVLSLGSIPHLIDSDSRRLVHLAAVFINNFSNYMLTAGNEVASRAGLSLAIFESLIRETVSKALELGPEASQTGPAVRNDTNTIKKHMELLSFSPELGKLYNEITDSIIKHYKIDS